MAIGDYSKTTYINGQAPAISASNLNKNEDKTAELDTALASHMAETAADGAHGLDGSISKFKAGSAVFSDNDTSQAFADSFCTANSLVIVSITSVTPPQGAWSVESANGYFTITSSAAESADITFDYYIMKVV